MAIAAGLKLLFLITTLLGATGLWMAILADTGATVLVTINALRLLGWRSPFSGGGRPDAIRIPRHLGPQPTPSLIAADGREQDPLLPPEPGNCCVFCAHGDVPRPSVQAYDGSLACDGSENVKP